MTDIFAEAQFSALEAIILPLFTSQPGEPSPTGIAKFCSAKDGNDAVLLAKLFQSINGTR